MPQKRGEDGLRRMLRGSGLRGLLLRGFFFCGNLCQRASLGHGDGGIDGDGNDAGDDGIDHGGSVGESISALASEIGVSDMTIRRDLHELSAQGYTTVINGVAILNDNQDGSKIKKDYFIHDERQSMSGSKEAIGLEACKAAINSSSTRILLVDSSKFGKMRPCMFSNLSDFDMVITDSDIGGNWISLFEQSNLKYIIV